jgi:hypothetical protein
MKKLNILVVSNYNRDAIDFDEIREHNLTIVSTVLKAEVAITRERHDVVLIDGKAIPWDEHEKEVSMMVRLHNEFGLRLTLLAISMGIKVGMRIYPRNRRGDGDAIINYQFPQNRLFVIANAWNLDKSCAKWKFIIDQLTAE